MADAKDDKDKAKEDAKPIDPSDMAPEELAKAIEQSVAHEEESKTAQPDPYATPKKTEKTKKPPEETIGKDEKSGKTEEKPPDNKQEAEETKKEDKKEDQEKNDDEGVPIIVKRGSGYMSPASGTAGKKSEEEKPLEPPSKTKKVMDPDKGAEKAAQDDSPKSEETQQADKEEPKQKPAEDKAQSPPNQPAAETEAEPKPEPEPSPTPAEPDKSHTASTPAKPDKPASVATVNVGRQKEDTGDGIKDPTEEKPQKPTVFDTTEYHLPIKASGRKYVNSAVSWIVLILALAAAAGYVLYRLGIVEIGDLKILG